MLPAASLVAKATGAPATGTLTARITPIDPAADPQSMPGDFSVSDTVRIESFGAVKVDLQDASGARLDLAPGSRATIRIPLASRSGTPPATIPLWWLDEATGRWVQEGSATLAGTAPNQYYEGEVSHFTYWNADQVQDTIFVNGCVRDAGGAAVAGAEVSTVGIDYSGTASSPSAADGSFRVPMKRGGRANLFAEAIRSSDTVIVGPSQTDITLTTCLVLTNAPVAPTVVEQPEGATVETGLPVVLHVTASGTRPFAYQWRHNGIDIAGATAEFLVIYAAQAGDAGEYTVVVTNPAGSVTSAPAAVVVNAPQPPVVLVPPAAASVAAGASATFSVVASGTAPLAYQWQRNGVDIAGATAAGYTTPPTVVGDSGASFRVRITNRVGSVTSAAATLTVTGPALAAPVITGQPSDATAPAGQTATFGVTTTGSPLPTYQWRRNGVAIPGATAASFTTPALTTADNGSTYSVVATNSQGSATSREALLTVTSGTSTDDKLRLMRLLGLTFDFYEAAAAPLLLVDDAGNFLAPSAACTTGSISATLGGNALPAPGTPVPGSGTLAATANACLATGTGDTYTGSSSVTFSLSNLEPAVGNASAVVNNMRITSRSGNTVDRDVTANGSGSVVFAGSVSGADVTSQATLTPASGATLRSELTGLTASFAGGSVGVLSVERNATLPVRIRATWSALRFAVSGTNYLADGFYELNFGANGLPTGGSGEVLLTSGSTRIGRIYATTEGVFIEVDGVVQPFAARRGPASR